MATDFNKVILGGRLSRNPELNRDPSGQVVCNFGIVNKRCWMDADRVRHEEVNFFDCTAWGGGGEAIYAHMHKGDPIIVEGRLRYESWAEKETQQLRKKVVVIVASFQNLERLSYEDHRTAAGGATAVSGQESIPAVA